MTFPYGRTITHIPITRDVHGDETRGVPRVLHGVGVAPRTSVEPSNDARSVLTITGVTLLLARGHGITNLDRVVLDDGTEWAVEGHPTAWDSPLTGWAPGDQVDLVRVEG